MKFSPVYNPESDSTNRLDIHEDPPGLWQRVCVIGMWQDAKITRKRWPFASCVGPLRTKAGIDLLVRNLAHNPQIRLIIVDGPHGRMTLPKQPILRAIALAADGQGGVLDSTKPIAVIEADTPGGLRTAIERSGLVVNVGGAMWLGAEIERVWGMK